MRQDNPSTRLALVELPDPEIGWFRSSDVSLTLRFLLLRESGYGGGLERLPGLKRTDFPSRT